MYDTQDPINERINFLINKLENGVRRRFALKVGVSAGMVSDLFSDRKNKPGIDMVRKILVAYPQISTDWLLLGEGEMVKKEASPNISIDPQNIISYMPDGVTPILPLIMGGNIATGLRTGQSVEHGGMVISTFDPPPTTRKPKQIQPVGMDLIQMVASHEADIQLLKKALASMQQQQEGATK